MSRPVLLPGLQPSEAKDIVEVWDSAWWYGPRHQERHSSTAEQPEHKEYAAPPRGARRRSLQADGAPGGGAAGSLVTTIHIGSEEAARWARAGPSYPHQNGEPAQVVQPVQQQQRQDARGEGMQLGTWADRKRVFSEHLRQEEATQEREQGGQRRGPQGDPVGSAAAGPQQQGAWQRPQQQAPASSPPQRVPSSHALRRDAHLHRQQSSTSTESDSELHAAWRWRFSRKWQMEQAKQFDPEFGKDGGDEDDFEAALKYMDAVEGLNLQMRTVSMGNSLSVGEHSMSMLSPSLSHGMLLDGSVANSLLREEAGDTSATQHIQQIARTAQHLLKHQQEIERQVSERWSAAGGPAPAGRRLGHPAIGASSAARLVGQLLLRARAPDRPPGPPEAHRAWQERVPGAAGVPHAGAGGGQPGGAAPAVQPAPGAAGQWDHGVEPRPRPLPQGQRHQAAHLHGPTAPDRGRRRLPSRRGRAVLPCRLVLGRLWPAQRLLSGHMHTSHISQPFSYYATLA